ncbi:MAG: VOC family protein [Acidimicrobiales bacterium]
MTSIRLQLVALDCPEPLELARFYSRLTGLEVEPLGDVAPEDVEWIELLNGDRPTIAFQKVATFVAPTWPEGPQPQQLHLDFYVDDLDAGEEQALALGATKTEFQPGTSFRVYLDPVGHPFCLVLAPIHRP